MEKIAYCFAIVLVTCAQTIFSQSANIEFDKTSPRQQYAASQIKNLPDNYHINLKVDPDSFLPESYAIILKGRTFTITGGDERGLIYGCLSLAEDIRNGIALPVTRPKLKNHFFHFALSNMICHGILTAIAMHWNCMIKPAVIPAIGKHFSI